MVLRDVRYRFKKIGGGRQVRLAFKGRGKVVEVAVFKKVGGVLRKQKVLMKKR